MSAPEESHLAKDAPVPFEEYLYWANYQPTNDNDAASKPGPEHKTVPPANYTGPDNQSDSRALRTAGWISILYLIVTDIFGPFSTPWAFAQLGYGPGIAIYTVFGGLSTYSGWILWRAYMALNSDRHPVRGYGDLFLRLFGPAARHLVNVCQSLQLLLSVSVTILSMGQSLSQISRGLDQTSAGICFVVCLLVFAVAGAILGQVRTLRRLSWFAHGAIWLNAAIVLICVAVVVDSPPNFIATLAQYGPDFGPGKQITKFGGLPPPGQGYTSGGDGFVGTLNGVMQAVCAYGGAMLFVAFLAEMRRPADFWKSLVCAELLIYVVYVFFGLFVYSFQGQFAMNPAMQGLSPYRWQTVANALNIGAGLVAATLYSNVGLKLLYVEVLQDVVRAPPLTSFRGKVYWGLLMPVYWAVAFIICVSVPMFSFVTGLIGAVFIMSFTFTLPALVALGYSIKKAAIVDDEEQAVTGSRPRYRFVDSGIRRFWRGFMERPWFNGWNVVYFLCALATCLLGVYTSVVALIAAFSGNSAATSWGCRPPV
ncbi:transmembrane amino acid transporter [Echria macrotheca]|uniref:Transmembrane amino acid transporter n=1 Tax=Echria macrotheca TaxID=438768 RepID=A0AAJ0F6E3_9PEZI|nr:transmembrane amino acid transporter [Echria macrotheca]